MKLDLKGIHEYQQNRDPYLLIVPAIDKTRILSGKMRILSGQTTIK